MDDQTPASSWLETSPAESLVTGPGPRSRPWRARTSVTIGMPQLDGCGLSETWLQKTCGEVHWRGLAASLGRPAQQWTDAAGQRVYAAFSIVRLQSACLGDAQEGQQLRLKSLLSPLSRSQAWSQHGLSTDSGDIGQLEMLSVFVVRGEDGSNRSVRRVPMRDQGPGAAPVAARALADRARAWRTALAAPAAPAMPVAAAPSVRFMSCPRGDFNGAGLVYFVTFTAWADRALFSWRMLGARDRVVERECLYLGNLDVGHEVEIVWCGRTTTPAGDCLEVEVRCPRHGRTLARVRTTTAPLATVCSKFKNGPMPPGLLELCAQ